jgi:type II secretory pathway pseudopilin PulG
LIEILLVIAIIGILAAAVFAMIGNSDNAKMKATLSTAKSILTYAQECQFKGCVLIAPTPADGSGEGDRICGSCTTTEWPELSVEGCKYQVTDAVNGGYEVDCSGAEITDKKIECSAKNGYCKEVDVP